ncbi:GrpB family protein [Paenibacillus sp. GSMTC-2017]|uniref:GrpB family protein n=1 Tax=Paenibacillus sp. GSMTC-2017 TaxID=2794350 RepID=UPI0018D7CC3F|nr:GrpB family protein [Paenibacillus sp. GSMTC-2017]MBH5317708.1 GrpB family protein [Paenibacillus sp. GSMTC-2017]
MIDHSSSDDYPIWAYEKVEIVSPNPLWIEKGKQESAHLIHRLSPLGVIEIEHIGSTSVLGLPAKPIIDLMASLKHFDQIDKIIDTLSDYGWHYVPPELDLRPWRRFFVKVNNDRRVAHLHLMHEHEERWNQQRMFRNKLIKDPTLVKQYAALKMDLSSQYKNDREAYSEAKKNFIMNVLHS